MSLTKVTYSMIDGAPVNVKDFGAVGDGVTDDTVAIQAAADFCFANNKTLVGEGDFVVSSTIFLNCNCALGNASFYAPATTVSPAIRFGPNSAVATDSKIAELPKVYNLSKTSAGWSGFDSSVGIDIANVLASQITVPRVEGFGIGIDVGGYETGNAFNNIFIGWIVNCKIGLKLTKKGTFGYSNSNTFYGGDVFIASSEGASVITGSYGVYCDQTTNNNTFVNISLEANQNQYQIYLHDSAFNKFITPRLEITGGGRIAFNSSFSEGCQGNIFDNGYSQATRQFTYIDQSSKYNESYDKTAKYFDFSPEGIAIRNGNGDGLTRPHITGYPSGTTSFLNKLSTTSTDWTYKLYSDGISFKNPSDSYATVNVTGSGGYLYFGRGISAPADYFRSMTNTPGDGIRTSGSFAPTTDNISTLGKAGQRWSEVFAGNGTINTSDEREKTFLTIEDAERAAALEIKANLRKFKFNSAIEKKGDNARIHFGVAAQQVGSIMESHGLDPAKYGFFCYDEWKQQTDENGNVEQEAGNRYGIRYDELLCFIMAAI